MFSGFSSYFEHWKYHKGNCESPENSGFGGFRVSCVCNKCIEINFSKQKAGEILNRNEVVLNRLRAIIGDELFREVCFQMPGEDIHIPVFGNGFTSIKDRFWSIRQDVWKGKSILEVSKKYELSQSQIYKILKSRE